MEGSDERQRTPESHLCRNGGFYDLSLYHANVRERWPMGVGNRSADDERQLEERCD